MAGVRQVGSRRWNQEQKRAERLAVIQGVAALPKPEPSGPVGLPSCDSDLPERVREIYAELVAWLAKANVTAAQIDSILLTTAARKLHRIEESEKMANDPEVEAKYRLRAWDMISREERDLIPIWRELGATPSARARILGQKPVAPKKEGPLAQLLRLKTQRG